MGGSGRHSFFESSVTPEDISRKIRDAEELTKNEAYSIDVDDKIRTLLTYANDRDTETVQTHLATIRNALHLGIDGTIDLRYGGSVSKHTYVDGLSDIDSLAIINETELNDLSPSKVKKYFYDRLKDRLPNTEIRIGKLAVTVKFSSGYEIQVLPAIKKDDGICIPSSRRDDQWSHVIQPKKFVEALRYANIKMSGKLVPVIKLAKSIISSFPEQRQLSGYHVEALAIEIFANYSGTKKHKEILKHFFNEGAKYVLNPIKDKSGQSIHVDDYLGETNSLKRKMVSDSMSSMARKMQNADGSREIRIWDEILK